MIHLINFYSGEPTSRHTSFQTKDDRSFGSAELFGYKSWTQWMTSVIGISLDIRYSSLTPQKKLSVLANYSSNVFCVHWISWFVHYWCLTSTVVNFPLLMVLYTSSAAYFFVEFLWVTFNRFCNSFFIISLVNS